VRNCGYLRGNGCLAGLSARKWVSNESCATLQPIQTVKTIFCVKILCKPPVFISLRAFERCASARKWVSNTFKYEEMGV